MAVAVLLAVPLPYSELPGTGQQASHDAAASLSQPGAAPPGGSSWSRATSVLFAHSTLQPA